jgi:predicted transcriptional regulator
MQLDLTPEQEAQLARMATQQGKDAEQLAKDFLLRQIDDHERFLAAVQVGIEQADRGEFIADDEIKGRIDRLLHQ